MKNIIIAFILILFVSAAVFTQTNLSKPAVNNRVFDDYANTISWQAEKAHLDNLVITLKDEPEFFGYIFIFTKENESARKTKARIKRIVRYLTKHRDPSRRLEKSRIRITHKANSDTSKTILTPGGEGLTFEILERYSYVPKSLPCYKKPRLIS